MAKQSKTLPGAPVITDAVRKLVDIKPDPKNARRHSEAQIAQVVQSIERFGYVDKIVIRPDGQLIGGEARWQALKRLDREEADCRVVAGLSEAGYRAMGLALNRIPENSRWDDDVLREILGEIQSAGESPIETGPVADEFWISIRGPLAHQAQALKALQDALRPYQGVTVEQGTISL